MAKIVYRAACWDCNDFYIGKAEKRLHDRKTEHFKALINGHHTSALADHVTSTSHSLKRDHLELCFVRARSSAIRLLAFKSSKNWLNFIHLIIFQIFASEISVINFGLA